MSVSLSPSLSPSPGYEDYTKGDEAVLPLDDTDLVSYTAQEVLDVEFVDEARVAQTATGQYAIHLYKQFSTATEENNECLIVWTGQTDSTNQVVLQIYNQVDAAWETLFTSPIEYGSSLAMYGSARGSYGGHLVDTDFVLSASIPDLTEYKDSRGIVSCRIYQLET